MPKSFNFGIFLTRDKILIQTNHQQMLSIIIWDSEVGVAYKDEIEPNIEDIET